MSMDIVYFHTPFFCHHACVHASLYLTVHVLATNAAGPERELDDIGDWMPIGVEDSLSRAGVDVLEREQGHGRVRRQVGERPVQVIGQQVVGPCHGREEGHLWVDALSCDVFLYFLLGSDELCSPRTNGIENGCVKKCG